MKHTLLLLFAAVTLLTACKKDDSYKSDEYEESYKKFVAFKTATLNSYTYTVPSGSVFGPSSVTILTVKNGIVISRSCKSYRRSDDGKTNVLYTSWDEDESSIGTHTGAADPVTLDVIYDKAKNVWLKADKKTNKIYFETSANGLISSCGYVPDGCQDDCFTGITLTNILDLNPAIVGLSK